MRIDEYMHQQWRALWRGGRALSLAWFASCAMIIYAIAATVRSPNLGHTVSAFVLYSLPIALALLPATFIFFQRWQLFRDWDVPYLICWHRTRTAPPFAENLRERTVRPSHMALAVGATMLALATFILVALTKANPPIPGWIAGVLSVLVLAYIGAGIIQVHVAAVRLKNLDSSAFVEAAAPTSSRINHEVEVPRAWPPTCEFLPEAQAVLPSGRGNRWWDPVGPALMAVGLLVPNATAQASLLLGGGMLWLGGTGIPTYFLTGKMDTSRAVTTFQRSQTGSR